MSKQHEEYYKPLITECLLPELFPAVNLYMKGRGGNYILYKTAEFVLSQADLERLVRNDTKYLYVRTGDVGSVTAYLESHLTEFLNSNDLSTHAKSVILQQTSIEYVHEILGPGQASAEYDLDRCKSLLKNLMDYAVSADSLLDLLKAISSGSLYILAHSVQVAILSMLVHDKLYQIDADEMLSVGTGGLFHDIGMTFLSRDLLDHPDALSDIAYKTIQLHPSMGHEFLEKTGQFDEIVLTIVKHHHERWDGSGYPGRLEGNNITRSAQVAALCDIYCALTNKRTYRKASTHDEAIEILASDVERNFNPEMFEDFKSIVGGEPAKETEEAKTVREEDDEQCPNAENILLSTKRTKAGRAET
ncbi:MAG: HD domain-containing phosphohydrolase [Oryzomonas sp.]|uniref:HD-GYP domain-containing protein n=1 Tax=Oryzomonas sp. TaxID=2855186 RepID=UPI0028506392|nr:HD domain-containing phosphohydrolase [Oryzomonas sp.]MDR3578589.1 HD domain-containing phosphohydrolase [Oryzomonas sp.]